MSDQTVLDLIGYAASVLVAISLMMSSVLRLRVINLLGAISFAVYGVLIDAVPVLAVNLLIVGINVFHLWKMRSTREYFELLEVEPDAAYLRAFLRFHDEQIRRFVPGFSMPDDPRVALFVLRDLVPAGVLLGSIDGDALRVDLDFVIPRYRDLKVGRYLFRDRCEYFSARGVRTVLAESGSPSHAKYLAKMGFAPVERTGAAREHRLRLDC